MSKTTLPSTPWRPILLAALAGTVLTTTGCAKRLGFWNRDRQQNTVQETEQQQRNATQAFHTNNAPGSAVQDLAMSTAAVGATEQGYTNPPASSPAPTQRTPQNTPPQQQQTTTNTQAYVAVTRQVPAGSLTTEPDPAATVTDGQVDEGFTPEPKETKPTPYSVHGGDLSAWVYSNAMGIELPTENAKSAYRATVNVRRVTDAYTGSDFDPIVAPDGETIVYASTQHSTTADIYTKAVNGAVITRLTDDPAQDVMPALSPDGRSLAFASDRAGSWDIYIIPSEGGKTLQVTQGTAHDLHPTFSPDGTKIAFCRLGQQSGRWELWVKDLSSDMPGQFIGYGLFPEWNPIPGAGSNGSELILFQRSRQRGDRAFTVWSIEYRPELGSAGRETEIASGASQALINPTWSRDGRYVSFAAVPYSRAWATAQSTRPEMSTIWMVSVDGTDKVKLTDGSSVDLMPAWGHNNNIFFVSNMDGKDHLWTMDLSQAIQTASLKNPQFGAEFANVPTENE